MPKPVEGDPAHTGRRAQARKLPARDVLRLERRAQHVVRPSPSACSFEKARPDSLVARAFHELRRGARGPTLSPERAHARQVEPRRLTREDHQCGDDGAGARAVRREPESSVTLEPDFDKFERDWKERKRRERKVKRELDAEEAPPDPPISALTVQELFALPPVDYLVDQLLPEKALCEIVGDSETLKSFFDIHLSLAIATGQETFFARRSCATDQCSTSRPKAARLSSIACAQPRPLDGEAGEERPDPVRARSRRNKLSEGMRNAAED